jgi:D-alanyl-lipoteichoic acid acyltransferase DltB (MBOAT superfamily)
MLFFSYQYIFAFLPLAVLGYFFLCKRRLTVAAQAWLVFCSLFFYSAWEISYLPLILTSILFNYTLASSLKGGKQAGHGKGILWLGILCNVSALGYYKYADFFIDNVNLATGVGIPTLNLALPLAISFFTFQQIAYLVDAYNGVIRERSFLNYCLFVTFFPQLISGPIVHHREMMPQFAALRNKIINYPNIARGMFIFTLGLIKKVLIADTFARWAMAGFDTANTLNVAEAWLTSVCYSLQLYFDFSGYMDMALGAALLFNIRLPINFNSPYKALSIQDFWRRWHITLSRFLRDYVYVPLGGNRKGPGRTYVNLFSTFLLGGLWHGAGWTFIFWGALHGAAAGIHKAWQGVGIRMPKWLAWFITFNFVNLAWVFFRAKEWDDAIKVVKGMVGMGAPMEAGALLANMGADMQVAALAIAGLMITVFAPNSHALAERFKLSLPTALAMGSALGAIAIYVVIDTNRVTEFIYFGF